MWLSGKGEFNVPFNAMTNPFLLNKICLKMCYVISIRQCLSHLKTGKAVSNDCLSAESFKYADTRICVFLCMLFNSILYHSYLPSKLMDTVIIPIVKDKKGDLGSKNNFRPIALTTIISKLFEVLILNRYGDLLQSTDNQFGYKKKHATDLCVYTLKQVVDYYRSNSSPVYICFLMHLKHLIG